jgi:capsular exopolysaccharide synthesis family protein
MELQLLLEILRRRAIVIIITTLLTVAVVVAAILLLTPTYRASATVRVIQDVGVLELNIRETYGERLMNTYSRILTGWPVLEEAAERVGSSLSTGQLREKVKVEVIPDTELMKIIVEDTRPARARDLANTLADLLVEQAQSIYAGSSKSALQVVQEQLAGLENELEEDRQQLATLTASDAPNTQIEALKSQIQFAEDAYDRLLDRYELARLNESLRANSINVVEPASLPKRPVNALAPKDVALALIVGLFGGVGLALVLENLDTRIHGPRQLEHLTQVPLLGNLPRGTLSLDSTGQKFGRRSSLPLAEAYRLLGINLQALGEESALKTILITSAVPREGKSTVTVNLAQALAERGQTVYLVEGDMRRPNIAKTLDIEDVSPGLAGLLANGTSLNHEALEWVIHPSQQPSLFVISGGATPNNPTALLASPPMEELLGYLTGRGQTILVDAPPVLGVADVSVLAPRVDGVILVVGQAHSTREQVLAALKQLKASRARIVGTVFLSKSKRGWGY